MSDLAEELRQKCPLSAAEEAEFKKQWDHLTFGTVEITPREEFALMLRNAIKTNTPLRIKCGIDPTGHEVHLGHLVPYHKMRQFEDFGHQGVVVIGDYTAQIGDPTGKNESRPALSAEQVKANAQNYMEQIFTVLNPQKTEVRWQSEWFTNISLRDVLHWASETTLAKLLSHETFAQRLKVGASLGLHEFFYPVLQGMDSVFIKADVELGGSDQKFNVLMGRDYQKNRKMRPQVAMLLPIITGTDGQQKMSKSLHNYIAIQDSPKEQFGKVMSIPDRLMLEYYQYLTNLTAEEFASLAQRIQSGALHPNEAKKQLAAQIVQIFYGPQVAQEARTEFERVFAQKAEPQDMPVYDFAADEGLVDVLFNAQLVASKSEARRLIKQNAVSIANQKITQEDLRLDASFDGQVVKAGKRKFLRLKLKA